MITTKKAKRVYKEVDVVADKFLEKIKISYATPIILAVIVAIIVAGVAWFYG
jgi:hypothetical protein